MADEAKTILINGEWRGAQDDAVFDVTDPSTGSVIGQVANGGTQDIDDAISAASDAFEAWSRTTSYERAAVLQRAHDLMRERTDELAALMTQEQGKPLRAAKNEVGYAADFLAWFAGEAVRVDGQTIPSARADQ